MGSTIDHATIITMDPSQRIINDGAVYVENGRIVDLGETAAVKIRNNTNDVHVDARGKVILPNFVNAHTHTFQTLRKGRGADLNLTDWLRTVIWPLSGIIGPDDMALGAAASSIEAIKSGCSYLLDNTTIRSSIETAEKIAATYERMHVKGTIALGLTERTKRTDLWNIPKERFPYSVAESIQMVREAANRLASKKKFGITVMPSPVTIFSAGPDLYRSAALLCDELGLYFTTHIAETRSEVESTKEDYACSEVDFLEKNGVLNEKAILAHCIWLEEREMEILSRNRCTVVHNPICNMYLGSGIADVRRLLEHGVNVAVGTDGGACGSSHEMFETIKSAALLQKAKYLDPMAITSANALEMATINGAKAVGLDSEIGSIQIGKSADFFVLNLNNLRTSPVGELISTIVYYANSSNVETVFVNGDPVMDNGQIPDVDELSIQESIQKRSEEIDDAIRSYKRK